MIARMNAEQLRSLAAQLDGYGMIANAGGERHAVGQVSPLLKVDGRPLAYLHYAEDDCGDARYWAEIISFIPGDCAPLIWHDEKRDRKIPGGGCVTCPCECHDGFGGAHPNEKCRCKEDPR